MHCWAQAVRRTWTCTAQLQLRSRSDLSLLQLPKQQARGIKQSLLGNRVPPRIWISALGRDPGLAVRHARLLGQRLGRCDGAR
jgi:hypothetical protein